MQKATKRKIDIDEEILCFGCVWWLGNCMRPSDRKCLYDYKKEKEVKKDAESVQRPR